MKTLLEINSLSSYTKEFIKILLDYSPKLISAFIIIAFCTLSCSNDDESEVKPIAKEYPENMIKQWDGWVTDLDFGENAQNTTNMRWFIKANGVLEVFNFGSPNTPLIVGTWYMNGNIFNCTYTINGKTYTYQLIKNKSLVMVGFRGLNNETSGAGRVNIYVI